MAVAARGHDRRAALQVLDREARAQPEQLRDGAIEVQARGDVEGRLPGGGLWGGGMMREKLDADVPAKN